MALTADALSETLALHRMMGDKHGEANDLHAIAEAELAFGEAAGAMEHCGEALKLHRETGNKTSEARDLELIDKIRDLIPENEKDRRK